MSIMKKVTFSSKLNLNKKTISKLQAKEMDAVKGGRGIVKEYTRGGNCTNTLIATC